MQIHVQAYSLKRTSIRSRLSLLDLPRFVRGHGFEGLEISDRQLVGEPQESLQQLARECVSNRCGLIIDLNVDFTSPDGEFLAREIAHAERMIRIGSQLGSRNLRICLGGQTLGIQKLFRRRRASEGTSPGRILLGQSPTTKPGRLLFEKLVLELAQSVRKNMSADLRGLEQKTMRAVASMREVARTAAEHDIRIGIENHWGISGDPRNILKIVGGAASPYVGTCPDLGNFPRGIDPQAGLEMLAPSAVIVHAKSYAFGADGEEKTIDYARCIGPFQENGFDGPITVEFEGGGDDLAGCRMTRDLILRHWALPASLPAGPGL